MRIVRSAEDHLMAVWTFLLAQSVSVTLLGADPPAARDAVTLTLNVAGAEDSSPRSIYDRVHVSGQVQPYGSEANIVVTLYHVQDESTWIPELGVVVVADAQGRFSFDIEPPHAGWMPGEQLVEVQTQLLRRLRAMKSLNVEAPKVVDKRARLLQQLPPHPPAKDQNANLIFVARKPGTTEKYFVTANFSVAGQIVATTPVEGMVSVKLYLVADEARWVPQSGVVTPARENGRFAVGFRPPGPGWPPGLMRVVVRAETPRVYETFDLEMVPRDDLAESDGSVRPLVESGIVIDTEEPPAETVRIPASAEFAVRGRFTQPGGNAGSFGTSTPLKLIRADGVIAVSNTARGFCETPDHWWFEQTLLAPPKPGQYKLTVRESVINVVISDPTK